MKTAIWWIRRDLRLRDNQALTQAAQTADSVAAVFILDPVFERSGRVGSKRRAFLMGGLQTLDRQLRARGGQLILRSGEPLAVLTDLLAETAAERIWAEADVTEYARRRDDRASERLPIEFTPGLTALSPGSVLKSDGVPYVVFSPFARRWKKQAESGLRPVLPAPEGVKYFSGTHSEPIEFSAAELTQRFPPGEDEAQRRLNKFVEEGQIFGYQKGRDQLDEEATSLLSPYLRFGMISARQAIHAARAALASARGEEAVAGAEGWLNELIWREFYQHILYHFPKVQRRSFRPAYRQAPWRDDPAAFEAWKAGMTGYPVIDAAMRQLAVEGWMPNRARMLTASFLAKHLLLDWRWGERWFMQRLIDGDVAANNGGWQWAAGTGTDAVPYFRIFNPITQGRKFDPDGTYIRRWVPELAGLARDHLHAPWQASDEERRLAGAGEYPAPIIEHAFARQRALDTLSPQRLTSP